MEITNVSKNTVVVNLGVEPKKVYPQFPDFDYIDTSVVSHSDEINLAQIEKKRDSLYINGQKVLLLEIDLGNFEEKDYRQIINELSRDYLLINANLIEVLNANLKFLPVSWRFKSIFLLGTVFGLKKMACYFFGNIMKNNDGIAIRHFHPCLSYGEIVLSDDLEKFTDAQRWGTIMVPCIKRKKSKNVL